MIETRDLSGLQGHLFAELERLGDPALAGDALRDEVARADAVVSVAKVAVENANVAIKATYLCDSFVKRESRLPKMLES